MRQKRVEHQGKSPQDLRVLEEDEYVALGSSAKTSVKQMVGGARGARAGRKKGKKKTGQATAQVTSGQYSEASDSGQDDDTSSLGCPQQEND